MQESAGTEHVAYELLLCVVSLRQAEKMQLSRADGKRGIAILMRQEYSEYLFRRYGASSSSSRCHSGIASTDVMELGMMLMEGNVDAMMRMTNGQNSIPRVQISITFATRATKWLATRHRG